MPKQRHSPTKIILSQSEVAERIAIQETQTLERPFHLLPVVVSSDVPSIVVHPPVSTKEEFTVGLMRRMRDFHANLTESLYTEFEQGKLSYREMRKRYSWENMNFYLDLNREILSGPVDYLGSLTNRMHLTKLIDRTTRNILEFLIRKYPPSLTKLADTELANVIAGVNRTSDLQNDILRNAGMSFVAEDQRDFTYSIKLWLNKLITETKEFYPAFKTVIKSIFTDGDNSLMGEETELEYEIGRKINETTPLYTPEELNMPGLQLKAPELLRILVKWTEELLSNFQHADRKIVGNKSGFKSVTHGLSISLTLKRKEMLAENLRDIYHEDIEKRINNRERHMYNIIN